jgi:A/G-specific adenine glycosylase
MLQQTQVKTVLPYWKRWMEALPDIGAVTRASAQTLHKLWEGLGYYTRVRNLQRAARLIQDDYAGRFPERFDQVLALPGIGRYTAGAICSIAFNQPAPVLDGNVTRVLSRLFGVTGDPRRKTTNAKLWRLAQSLADCASQGAAPDSCSKFSQSLMELGALVCTPREPGCGLCPVSSGCVARRQGRVAELPQTARRPRATARHFAAFVVRKRGRFLVRQRPPGVVNAHLWEFPNIELAPGIGRLQRAARDVLGIEPASIEPLCTLRHSITRYRITLEAFFVEGQAGLGSSSATGGRWLNRCQLAPLPFASAHKKILRHLDTLPTGRGFRARPENSRI